MRPDAAAFMVDEGSVMILPMPAIFRKPTTAFLPCIFTEPGRWPRVALIVAFWLTLMCAPAAMAQAEAEAARTTTARAVAGAYRIDDIGKLATIAADVTVSLNDDGAVAYWTRTNGAVHAAIWRDGRTTVIENMPGYPNSIAHAINRAGDIAGWMNTSGNLGIALQPRWGLSGMVRTWRWFERRVDATA